MIICTRSRFTAFAGYGRN